MEDAVEVGGNHILPFVGAGVGYQLPIEFADVVDEDVEAAEALEDGVYQELNFFGVDGVGFYCETFGALGLECAEGGLGGSLIGAIGDGDADAFLGAPLGKAFADAPAAAGDERGAIAKWHAVSWEFESRKYNEFFEDWGEASQRHPSSTRMKTEKRTDE